MAESIFNAYSGKYLAESAGVSEAEEIDYLARKIIENKGMKVKERPENIEYKNLDEFQHIIIVCDDACVSIPGKDVRRWNIRDPSGKSMETYEAVFDEIDNKVRILLKELEKDTKKE